MHTVFLPGKCRYMKRPTCVFVSSLLWCHVTSLFTRSVSTDGAISFPDSSFLRWVKQAWRDIPEEMVRRSFKTCGISITHSMAQKTMQSSTRIFQNKKKVKTRKSTTNSRQTERKKRSNKIDPDHTTTRTAPLRPTK